MKPVFDRREPSFTRYPGFPAPLLDLQPGDRRGPTPYSKFPSSPRKQSIQSC